MTTLETFKKKHSDSDKVLKELAAKKTDGKVAGAVYALVGYNLNITGQSVYNYVCGKGRKDGYLKEAIITEFQKLK